MTWRVAITGGQGHLGQALVARLAQAGAEVTVLDVAAPGSSLRPGARYVTGSILDAAALDAAVRGCAAVFHLAAVTVAQPGAADLRRYVDLNVHGTAETLAACGRQRVGQFILASSAHVYGRPRQLPVTEAAPLAPRSMYGASKAAAEMFARAHAATSGCACTVARISNLYGPGSGSDSVIGRAVRQAAAGGPIALQSLTPVRDFIAVQDAAEALLRLAQASPAAGTCEVVNVSTAEGTSVRSMADELAQAARVAVSEPSGAAEDDIPVLVLDNARLQALTGWRPSVSLAQGLRQALAAFAQPAASGAAA